MRFSRTRPATASAAATIAARDSACGELTQLEEHHQKTIRLLLRLQTQRRKATAPAPQAAKPAPISHPKPIAVPTPAPALASTVSTHAPPNR